MTAVAIPTTVAEMPTVHRTSCAIVGRAASRLKLETARADFETLLEPLAEPVVEATIPELFAGLKKLGR